MPIDPDESREATIDEQLPVVWAHVLEGVERGIKKNNAKAAGLIRHSNTDSRQDRTLHVETSDGKAKLLASPDWQNRVIRFHLQNPTVGLKPPLPLHEVEILIDDETDELIFRYAGKLYRDPKRFGEFMVDLLIGLR